MVAVLAGGTLAGAAAIPAAAQTPVPYLFVTGNNSVTEYAPGGNGNVAPVTDITGCCTLLHASTGMAVDASGDTFVTDVVDNYVTEYAPDATGDVSPIATISGASTGLDGPVWVAVATFVPGAPTGVSATPGNTQISVSWSAPASDGGLAITGYKMSAQAGGTPSPRPSATHRPPGRHRRPHQRHRL